MGIDTTVEQLSGMTIPSGVTGPVLGAFISGLIGVGTVEYRNWREGNDELRSWYDQAIRLAERVNRADTEDEYDNDRGRHVQATCAGVHSRLATHVSEAPADIEESILNASEALISDCQEVQILQDKAATNPELAAKRMDTATDSADRLIQEAKAARTRVGLG
ncbi:MAG: hypothetical protein ABEI52_06495 [Halobacteriaceae archaeon]